jgi:hypothetical protein
MSKSNYYVSRTARVNKGFEKSMVVVRGVLSDKYGSERAL